MIGFLKRYGLLALIAAGAAAALASGLADEVSMAGLEARRVELAAFVQANYAASLAGFVLIYVAVVALSLPLALVMTVSGGLLFGPVVGALASVTGATLGSTVAFLACRTAFGDFVARRAGPMMAAIAEGFRKDAFSYLVTVRIIPLFPLLLVNAGAGVCGVPLRTFMTASFIGMAPGSFVYAWLGSGLGTIFDRGEEPDLSLLAAPGVILPLAALALLALAPIAYRRLVAPARHLK